MQIRYSRSLSIVSLLYIFAASNVSMYAEVASSTNTRFGQRQCADKIRDIQVGLRRKYSDPKSLRFYGITYQQLHDIIVEASERLLKENRNNFRLDRFERELNEEVFGALQFKASKHHVTKDLSTGAVRQRIQEHELKLRRQYGKADQLRYYEVSYQELYDIIKDASRALFSNNDDVMITTEAQLDDLFRMHTDAVLCKLREHRDSVLL
jgi:hypothetical protein